MAIRTRQHTNSPKRLPKWIQGAVFLVCMLVCILYPAFGAIVLQYADVAEGIDVTITDVPLDPLSMRVAVCRLSLFVKGPGLCEVRLTHTPLFDGARMVGYDLVYEDGPSARSRIYSAAPESIILPCIWARLTAPLGRGPSAYSSTITVHVTVMY